MILSSVQQNEIIAECEVCRREIAILKNEIASETPESIQLRVNVKCACCSLSNTVSRTKTSHAATKRALGDLHMLLSKKDVLTSEQDEINECLANNYPQYPILHKLKKGAIFVAKLFGILLLIGAIAEALLFAVSGVIFLITKFFPDLELIEMANLVLNKPNETFMKAALEADGLTFKIFAETFKTTDEYILRYIPSALVQILNTIFKLTIFAAVIREGYELTKFGIHLYKKEKHKRAVIAYKPTGQARLEQIEGELYEVNEHIDLTDIVPRNYLNTSAVQMILSYFADNRIENMKEAINLFNEEKIKLEQSEVLRSILEQVKAGKEYSRALYSFSINPYDHQVQDFDE